jgi:hypothetical protein
VWTSRIVHLPHFLAKIWASNGSKGTGLGQGVHLQERVGTLFLSARSKRTNG